MGVQSAERVDETEDGRVGCERWRDARREMRARTPTGPKRLWPGLDAGFLTSGAPRVLGGAAGNLRSEEAPRSPNAAGRADLERGSANVRAERSDGLGGLSVRGEISAL